MKILHLCLASYYIDNYSYQENMLPKYHKMMGYDVSVIASLISYDKNGSRCLLEKAEEYMCNDGYKVTRLNYKKPFKKLNQYIRRYENTYITIRRNNPSIIFIHGCQFWDIRDVIKYLRRNQNTKVFVDNHADLINSARSWISRNILHKIIWKYFAKCIEPFTEKFYGVTPLRCDFLRDIYNIETNKIELLLMGADDKRINIRQKSQIRRNIRNNLGISENDFVIITGGKIDERKNIPLLMQAVIELENENVKLVLFGTPNQKVKPIIEDLGKSSRIINIGWIESFKIYDYFLASDLAVFPGTHSVLWEQSVGTGIPGVFKYWKGMDHVDIGGNCKFLFSDTVAEIKHVLDEIVSNRSEYDKMKKVAVEVAMERFSYTAIARKAIDF